MGVRFDPTGLLYLLVLAGVVLGVGLAIDAVERHGTDPATILALVTGVFLAVLLYKLFQIPICMKLGWNARGEALVKRGLSRVGEGPAGPPLRFNLFYFLYQQGKLAEAEGLAAALHDGDFPDEMRPVLAMNRATLMLATERYQSALDTLRAWSVEEFPDKVAPVFLNNLAFAYWGLGVNLDEAVELVDRGFGMNGDPRFAGTLSALANAQYQPDTAVKWADYGLKRLPRRERGARSFCLLQRATAFDTLGRHHEAWKDGVKALAVAPGELHRPRIAKFLEKLEKSGKTGVKVDKKG